MRYAIIQLSVRVCVCVSKVLNKVCGCVNGMFISRT